MPDFVGLKQLIDADINNASLTDQQVAVLLNAQTKTVLRSRQLTARNILQILGATNGAIFLDNLETISINSSAVKWIMRDILQGGVDISDSETQKMLGYLVSVDLVPQVQVDLLTASAQVQILDISEVGFSFVYIDDIIKARAL